MLLRSMSIISPEYKAMNCFMNIIICICMNV